MDRQRCEAKDFLKVFYEHKTSKRPSMDWNPFEGVSWNKDLLRVIYGSNKKSSEVFFRTKAFWRSSWTEDLRILFHVSKLFLTSYLKSKAFEGLLRTEDLLNDFYGPTIIKSFPLNVFFRLKTLWMSPMGQRKENQTKNSEAFFWKKDLLKVFIDRRPS